MEGLKKFIFSFLCYMVGSVGLILFAITDGWMCLIYLVPAYILAMNPMIKHWDKYYDDHFAKKTEQDEVEDRY